MLSPTLIGNEVVQVRQPRQKRLLTATWMVKPLHREQLPLDFARGVLDMPDGETTQPDPEVM
jgi:hypothetical protein